MTVLDDAEIEDLDEVHLLPVATDEHVRGFDVAMYEAPRMRLREGMAHLAE
jgi:hypothetical protein